MGHWVDQVDREDILADLAGLVDPEEVLAVGLRGGILMDLVDLEEVLADIQDPDLQDRLALLVDLRDPDPRDHLDHRVIHC